jgi:hypothetical protein
VRPAPQKTDRKKAAVAKNAAQRKKLIVAMCLLAVMAILWVRLFAGKSKPKAATAEMITAAAAAPVVSAGEQVMFVDLPVIDGRHNTLANDFFDAKFFNELSSQESAGSETNGFKGNSNSGSITAAVDAMELVAIVNDTKPQAFIEDKLLEEGQSFRFVFHEQGYEFKVIKIYDNKVDLECNGIKVTKKIPELSSRSEQ